MKSKLTFTKSVQTLQKFEKSGEIMKGMNASTICKTMRNLYLQYTMFNHVLYTKEFEESYQKLHFDMEVSVLCKRMSLGAYRANHLF